MMISEFDLISRYFANSTGQREDVALGVGDDCALLRVPEGYELAVTMDSLVAGVHFYPDADPESLGHKALAVNLSDLAAMGARPAWATLALTLPETDLEWLAAFMTGFRSLADRYGVQLIGGDTTHGPLSMTLQAHGFTRPGKALRRDSARVGDLVGVTGTLGDAGLALMPEYDAGEHRAYLRDRLERPAPRVEAGLTLIGMAHAAIDISDGLLADLGHICERSGTGATLNLEQIPLSPAVLAYVKKRHDWSIPLSAGDDYELCFTVPTGRRQEVEARLLDIGCGLTWIGVIEGSAGIRCLGADGREVDIGSRGYQHFHQT